MEDRAGAEESVACRAEGGVALEVGADVTKETDVANLFAEAKRAFGRVDIVVKDSMAAEAVQGAEGALPAVNALPAPGRLSAVEGEATG